MNNNKEKILILSGTLGDGHNQAAQAILEAARFYRPGAEVEIVDFLEWTHPYLHTFGKFCYLQWVKGLPSLYGYLYRKTRDDNKLSSLFKSIKSFSTDKMLRLLQEIKPTVVVSTFPGAAAAMSFLKSNLMTDIPTVTVITDYTDHSYWVHPFTDRYIVGAEHVKQALLKHHVPDERIVVTGIPIKLSFTYSYDRIMLRDKYGLDRERPIVLVMGGGDGLIGKQFLSFIVANELLTSVQFIIVCGRNERLRQSLVQELCDVDDDIRERVLVTGFVNHVHELMALSDLIVTKAGGLTVSEALALELPMILYRPLPGQEQANSAYLVNLGVALEASNASDLKKRLQQVTEDKSLLMELRNHARSNHIKEGAYYALVAILEAQNDSVTSSGIPMVYANA
ncbi:glycosyltransferase [Paenibacillus sediminis]|uniref:Processive 1,2-diacylglycerol beta-glucosyltransferase n=1 Tax=Paenibacillus sediminis TaxID=664909 RepID=A0ABS4H511_9BACL|nr:glycosyltransferase [Paenibacillus sediminis]MBP1937551.1 processive 1,2-diacylglycerol beta-glucosyltransferase [Paenibacillus sediminis]